MKQGEYYWYNRKVILMFFLAKVFGKIHIGNDFQHGKHCKVTMKHFCGKFYVIKEEWI